MNDFELTDGERASPVWMRLRLHLTERLDTARARNDTIGLPRAETAALRGEIRVLKQLLRLNEPRPVLDPYG